MLSDEVGASNVNETTGLLHNSQENTSPRHSQGSHSYHNVIIDSPDVTRRSDPTSDRLRNRRRPPGSGDMTTSEHTVMAQDLGFEWLTPPENLVEAHRMANNYMFGFRKWKSHVTQRPLSERSEVVQQLYSDMEQVHAERQICNFGNVFYVLMFGWWLSLMYCIIGVVMAISLLGIPYCKFAFRMALYLLWPFGKFVHKNIPTRELSESPSETAPLAATASFDMNGYSSFDGNSQKFTWESVWHHGSTGYWRRPSTYIWLGLACPVLCLMHSLCFLISWLLVVTIPVSKINTKTIQKVLLLPPELLRIDNSSLNSEMSGDIIMYTHQAVNLYYYKYTVDGVNVICVNLLAFVVFALLIGYIDTNHQVTTQITKFILSLISIIPLAYYIGMSITSISAQTNFAVGAVLNASFGSVVEIVLYITALQNGNESSLCYADLVKAGLVGTLLATTMLIPGLSMVIGGLKHQSQTFNPRAAGITATLLFVSVAGVFAPSIFSRAYGTMSCERCSKFVTNGTENGTWGLDCDSCHYSMTGHSKRHEFFEEHIMPLVYCCAVILPTSYIIGLIYSLKTHRAHIYDTFAAEVTQGSNEDSHHSAHWGRIKSLLILVVAVTLMSLCADLVTVNIEPLLTESGVPLNFVGVTLLAIVPDIPEIIIGIQFALQNNISLSIEVGNCIAVQVCMVQVPLLVLANIIKPLGFYLVFSDIHIWSVIMGVLINNYVLQDGKSNYFQGSALILSYLALIMMYLFSPNPQSNECG